MAFAGALACNPALAERNEPERSPAAPSVPASDIPMDEAGFTAYMARELADALPDAELSIAGPLTIMLKLPAGTTSQANLDRFYGICREHPGDCSAAVEQYVAAIVEMAAQLGAKPDREMLRAALRPTDYVNGGLKAYADEAGGKLVTRPLPGGVSLVVYFDYPQTVRATFADDLARLELAEDEAIALATQNVAAALPPLRDVVVIPDPGRFGIIEGDPFESSRLLLHDDWAWLAEQLNGHLIVAVPTEDVVLYGSDEDPDAVAVLASLAAQFAGDSGWALSSTIFRWTRTGWEPVLP